MKNKILSMLVLFVFALFSQSCLAGEDTFFGIGAELFKDPFNNKLIITKIFPDSPAEKAGITVGSEIISVDGEKVRKMCICEVTGRIRGEENTTVKLVIRKGWLLWKTYEIAREQISVPIQEANPELERYWKQIAPECFLCSKGFPAEAAKKFSVKYKRTILPVVNYWAERKTAFEEGFATCKSYSKNNQEQCLINFMNRENLKTVEDKKLFEVLRPALK